MSDSTNFALVVANKSCKETLQPVHCFKMANFVILFAIQNETLD